MSTALPRIHSLQRFANEATAWTNEASWGHTAPEQNQSHTWSPRKFYKKKSKHSCMNQFKWTWDYKFSAGQIALCSVDIPSQNQAFFFFFFFSPVIFVKYKLSTSSRSCTLLREDTSNTYPCRMYVISSLLWDCMELELGNNIFFPLIILFTWFFY